MALYARLMGLEAPKISVHAFMSAMQEFVLGGMTGQQATEAFSLDAGEQAEALALRDRILTESGASGGIARWRKALEFENVLILAEGRIAPYDSEAAVKTRLGV